jgi:hypothetical protein
MKIARIDLDEVGSPTGLVATILKILPDLSIPVPIEELSYQLDISTIEPHTTEAFEGCLITDADRHSGAILFNGSSHRFRQRFTIAHELGHFLIPSHIPNPDGRFLCSKRDMERLSVVEGSRRAKMEVEANTFASLMLIPPPVIKKLIRETKHPDLGDISVFSRTFEVSKLAMALAYTNYHPSSIAIIIVQDGIIKRIYRNSSNFQYALGHLKNQKVPLGALFYRGDHKVGEPSDIAETCSELWLEQRRGKPLPVLYEQVYRQQQGFGMIMLWAEEVDDEEYDEDENRTSAQRLANRRARYF